MGLLLLLYDVQCRAPGHQSSTTTSLATMGCDAISIDGATRTGGVRIVHLCDYSQGNGSSGGLGFAVLAVRLGAISLRIVTEVNYSYRRGSRLRFGRVAV